MNVITDKRCTEYSAPGHPERPARISRTVERLKEQDDLKVTWAEPQAAPEEALKRAHEERHITRIKTSREHFDGDTPWYPKIDEHAMRSVGGALKALALARKEQRAISLMRPPGHHATQTRAMGFCYFNSIAIASLQAVADGVGSVAVLDFDVHHGNGTEAILLDKDKTAFFSIHQHPCYPGTGTKNVGKNCFNYPVAPQTPRKDYRVVLQKAMEDLQRFKPDLVAVSAGFDAYARDPLAQETLEAEDFHWLGESIRQMGTPSFAVLEGGYSRDLPDLVLAFLKGYNG